MSSLITDVNYTDLLVEALSRFPRREAFVFGDRRITYSEVSAGVSRFMQVLSSHGVHESSAVGLLSGNLPEVWMLQAACYLLGAVYTGLHPLGSTSDHAYICGDAGVEVLLVHPDRVGDGLCIAERSPQVRHVLSLGPSPDAPDLTQLAARREARRLRRRSANAEDVRWIPYTGGTTGKPKGVCLPDRALVQQVQTVTTSLGLPECPRFLAVAPISHAGVLPILPTLARGGTIVLERGFQPDRWLHLAMTERISWSFVVPTMLYALLDSGLPGRFDLTCLESIMYGASPMSPARIAEAHDVFGPILLQAYGQTECVSFATTLRKDEHDPKGRPDLLASCGRAILGMRVEILDEHDQPVRDGEIGEVCVRGPGVMSRYHNRPGETAEALRSDWLHTGDLGSRDDRGFFFLVERKKDMIISGGFNVYSREVEDVIASHPAVSAAAVIGVPDERWGEAVMAFVVPRPGAQADSEAIMAYAKELKGAHQAPKRVEIVSELPLTAIGKVDKKALRARFWPADDRQVN
jgi:fatty-acyl-CoA synthase